MTPSRTQIKQWLREAYQQYKTNKRLRDFDERLAFNCICQLPDCWPICQDKREVKNDEEANSD
jgi:hypothetical protein